MQLLKLYVLSLVSPELTVSFSPFSQLFLLMKGLVFLSFIPFVVASLTQFLMLERLSLDLIVFFLLNPVSFTNYSTGCVNIVVTIMKQHGMSVTFLSNFFFCTDRVTITNGVIQGNRLKSFQGSVVYEFLGIPYAEPPTGSLRFKNPQPLEHSWKGVLATQEYKEACPQLKQKPYSEDCLHLNVWVPANCSLSQSLKDVMVYFHGGAFVQGSASKEESNGSVLAAVGDVIVVTVNYRLGFLGFLVSGDEVNSNMGLRDQQLALKWVHDNIGFFGGNANSVTLFGHSAGSISVSLHAVNPVSSRLFHRAILQSGAPNFNRPTSLFSSQARSLAFSQFLNCSSPSDTGISQESLSCLKALSLDILLSFGAKEPMHSPILPTPVFGDSFLSSPVSKLLSNAIKSGVKESGITPLDAIMIGFEANEGNLFVRSQLPKIFKSMKEGGPKMMQENKHAKNNVEKEQSNDLSYSTALKVLQDLYASKHLSQNDISSIASEYLSLNMTSDLFKDNIARSYGDLYVYCPSLFLADSFSRLIQAASKETDNGNDEATQRSRKERKRSSKERVFMYLKESKMSQKPHFKKCPGVCHGEEIPYVFGHPFLSMKASRREENYSEADKLLSLRMMKAWTDFARDG